MIRISKKADYAIFIMSHLARQRAQRSGVDDQPMSAQDLAAHIKINKSVVANLCKDLAGHGLLRSVRGVYGGYSLAETPRDITLASILEAVEGPFSLVECAHDRDPAESEACACVLSSYCPSREPLQVLHDRIVKLMEKLTLDELCSSPLSIGQAERTPQ